MSNPNPVLQEHIEKSLYQFLLKASTPIFSLKDDDPRTLCGSGTYFQFDGRTFLVTAAHTVSDEKPESLAVPKSPTGGNLVTLGSVTVSWPQEDDLLDVAVLELMDSEFVSSLANEWLIFDEGHIGDYSSGEDAHYLVVGHPAATITASDKQLVGRPYPLFGKPSEGKPVHAKGPAYLNVDIFLDEVAPISGFEKFRPERLQGISGSAIWRVFEVPSGELWSPEKALRLVGIQCSVRNGDFVRGKQWRWVKGLLDRC